MKDLPYFGLGLGAFLALYLPQPLLPVLDRDLGTSPAVTGLVMTAALLGFAAAGLLPERDPPRTLRLATWLIAAGCLVAAASPHVAALLAAGRRRGSGSACWWRAAWPTSPAGCRRRWPAG